MPDIHPSSTIDPEVKLADDVYIGPGCVLRGAVTIGKGCKLHGNVYMHGPLTMGDRNRVYPFTCMGFSPQDLKFDPATPGTGVIIGDDNIFREGVTVHRATHSAPTIIGSHCFFMANSHVAHDCVVGDHVTLVNGALMGGHAHVADRSILGGNSAVHQFCRVGRLAVISGVVGITQDVPPFCVAHYLKRVGSLNLVGLRRAGLREHIGPLQQAFDIFFRSSLPNKAAVDQIRTRLGTDPLCLEFADFIVGTRRGICAYAAQAEL